MFEDAQWLLQTSTAHQLGTKACGDDTELTPMSSTKTSALKALLTVSR